MSAMQWEKLVLGPWQTKMLAQRGSRILAAEDASALQLRDDKGDKIIESGRHGREHDVEPVGGTRLQPRLHRVGDLIGGSDHLQPAEAADQLSELTDC